MVKFRGKRVDNEKWFEGDLVRCSGKHAYIIGYFEKGEYLPKEDLCACKCVVHKVKLETVGMGIEIDGKWYFEGDVCSFVFDGNNRIESIAFVNGSLCLGCCMSLRQSQIDYHKETKGSLEIIGNIWDNPELLGGQNEQEN